MRLGGKGRRSRKTFNGGEGAKIKVKVWEGTAGCTGNRPGGGGRREDGKGPERGAEGATQQLKSPNPKTSTPVDRTWQYCSTAVQQRSTRRARSAGAEVERDNVRGNLNFKGKGLRYM